MQSILESLQLIQDFLAINNTIWLSVCKFPVVSVKEEFPWSNGQRILLTGERIRFPCSPGSCGHEGQAHKSDCMFNTLKLKLRLAYFSYL